MITKAPIFIVGVPRSGTTLLAAMLAAHPNLSCGPETHFFRWIQRVDPKELVDDPSWPDKAVEFVSSIIRRSYTDESPRPLIEKYGVGQDQIQTYLSQHRPSVAVILSSITESYMLMSGKNRWVEKTPDHIEYLADIRRNFPDASIIRILRDPRDIALSLSKVPWGVNTLFEGLVHWKRLDDLSRNFFDTDTKSYTLRFEDLIQNTQTELIKLCDFIEEAFSKSMLDTTQSGKLLNSRNVPWKNKASQPVDKNRVSVWEKEISQVDNMLAESYLGDRLEQYGYKRLEKLPNFATVFPGNSPQTKYDTEMKQIASMGVRFWKTAEGEKPNTMILFGDPADTDWTQDSENKPYPSRFSLVLKILDYKVSKRNIIWVPGPDKQAWTGYSASLIKFLLKSNQLQPYTI